MKPLRVAAVQFQHAPGHKAVNRATIEAFVERAADDDAEVVVFPECCVSGYWHLRHLARHELVELAEPVPDGETCRWLLDLARARQMTIGVGLVEISRDGELYNSYVVAMSDGSWRCHRKLHCFISPHMKSGERLTVFDTPHGWRMGVLICYDNNLVENVRMTALAGAKLLLAPHQTGGCRSGSPHAMGRVDVALWENRLQDPATIEAEFRGDKGRGWLMRWLPSRAHDNGIFLAFSNGVGRDDNEVRTGGAMLLDPYGRSLTETTRAADDIVAATLDPELLERSTGARWIRARRPELYQPLTELSGREQDTRQVRFEYDEGN